MTAEEWADQLISNQIAIINEIKKEAWNEAIDAACLSACLHDDNGEITVDEESILKLKKK